MVGFDIETTAPEVRPAIALTRQGGIAANQPPASSVGLDPLRARMRLAQVYDGRGRAFVFDLDRVPLGALAPLWRRQLVIHNALFELGFLMVAGIEPERVACTMQMAGLLLGTNKGCRTLAHAAEQYLGIEDLPKGLQTSDWGAKRLSPDQVAYAALDAVLALASGPRHGARARRCGARLSRSDGCACADRAHASRRDAVRRRSSSRSREGLGARSGRCAARVRRGGGQSRAGQACRRGGIPAQRATGARARLVADDRYGAVVAAHRRPGPGGGRCSADPPPARGSSPGEARARLRPRAAGSRASGDPAYPWRLHAGGGEVGDGSPAASPTCSSCHPRPASHSGHRPGACWSSPTTR